LPLRFINLVVARILLSAGRQRNSITLEADARHLMTDVWTSVGRDRWRCRCGVHGLAKRSIPSLPFWSRSTSSDGLPTHPQILSGHMDEALPEQEQNTHPAGDDEISRKKARISHAAHAASAARRIRGACGSSPAIPPSTTLIILWRFSRTKSVRRWDGEGHGLYPPRPAR